MQVQPYLFFDGRCEEAIEFYKKALGAKVEMLMRFKESPDPEMCPASGGQVQMPLGETFFATRFGMVADRFGVGWMIVMEKK